MFIPDPEKIKRVVILQVPVILWLLFKILVVPAGAVEVLLRDMSHIQGLRENQLMGYGLVVGLQGTGDSRYSMITTRSIANMLEKFGLDSSRRDFSARNCAAVMVTGTLMPFTRQGNKIDVNIASIGDAKSLQGGTLLMTSLYAGNQKVYATAQGPISVGGYYAGRGSQSIQKNVTTVGVITGGGIVEQDVNSEFLKKNKITLTLERTDFILADRVVNRIDERFGQGTAETLNGTDITVNLPEKYRARPVAFIAEALALSVRHEEAARVVVDERTGTIVVGGAVGISKVAVSHGGLHIAIAGEPRVSQPLPFANGHTIVAEQLALRSDERSAEMMVMPEGTTIEELVRVLNAVGTLPRDIIVILENIKALGALHAEIITR